jgi:hypothetical protein
MALSKIPSAGFQDNVKFRNIIINGDQSIAQRGTSTSSLSSGANFGATDRFKLYGVTFGTWTMSQSTDVPTGQGFVSSLKMDCTTANGSLSSDSQAQISQGIEGQNLQYIKKGTSNAESLTWSFWTKSNKTGTYICQIRDIDNSRSISKSYTISSADTWEKKIITFPGDTTGALDNDSAKSFEIRWWLVAGTDFTSGTLATSWGSETNANNAVGQVNLADSTSNEWYLTSAQLEAGTTASDFEFLPFDVNLKRCQRYYQTMTLVRSGSYYASAAANVRSGQTSLPTFMRTNASITFSSQGYSNASSLTVDGTDEGHFNTYCASSGAGGFYWEANVAADAEL